MKTPLDFCSRLRQMPRSLRLTARALDQELLDDTVLEGMERDDDEAAAWFQDPLCRSKPRTQFAQFIVDVNAERLERAGCGMTAILAAAAHHA